MTVSPSASLLRAPSLLLAGMLTALPVHAALAWQQKTQTPPPRPAPVYVSPPPNAQFQQSMRQQQVRDQLQKNQVEEQLRQSSMETLKRPSVDNKTHTDQLDQADRAQNEAYRARQQGLIDRYQSTAPPPVIRHTSKPAPARSGG